MHCDEDSDTQQILVLPDACVELFISYTETPVAIIGNQLHKRSIVTFRMSRPMDVQMRKGSGCLAICFYPGMAYQFFELPMQEYSNSTTALTELWKEGAEEMEYKLAHAGDNDLRIDILQQYLLQKKSRTTDDRQINFCLQQIQNSDKTTVANLAGDTGLSQRHLARKFQQCIGLSPKEYLSVNRFIRSLQYLKKHPQLSLTEIAYESGYYDQAHFIRDYKCYAAHTPGEVAKLPHILY
jgi:AraC-like DNA-binding protein